MKFLKKILRQLLRKAGYDISSYNPGGPVTLGEPGRDPFLDMKNFLPDQPQPLILDVGGNLGQSVDKFKKSFPDSVIHSFEPAPDTYTRLESHCSEIQGVKTWNCGIGSTRGTLPFHQYNYSDMSSFLTPGSFSWGKIEKTIQVEVLTLDAFAEEQRIDFIHILKSDTQGYDMQVFKGAKELMRKNRIGLVYFEFTFSDLYKNLPAFHEIFRYLSEHNFSFVSFYQTFYQRGLLSWTDLLFINNDYNRLRLDEYAGQLPDPVRVPRNQFNHR